MMILYRFYKYTSTNIVRHILQDYLDFVEVQLDLLVTTQSDMLKTCQISPKMTEIYQIYVLDFMITW